MDRLCAKTDEYTNVSFNDYGFPSVTTLEMERAGKIHPCLRKGRTWGHSIRRHLLMFCSSCGMSADDSLSADIPHQSSGSQDMDPRTCRSEEKGGATVAERNMQRRDYRRVVRTSLLGKMGGCF